MSNLSTRSIITIFFVLLGISLASSTFALELDYPSWFPIKEGMKLSELVLALFNVFLVVAGVAAFIMLMVAGIRYLTSIGNPGVAADARNQAFSAILGLALLLCSYLILTTINPQLVELKEPGLPEISPVVIAGKKVITVSVDEPTITPREQSFDFGQGVKEIGLKESLRLVIDTSGMQAKLLLRDTQGKDVSAMVDDKPWERNLEMGKAIREGRLTVKIDRDDIEGFKNGDKIDTEFEIAVGEKKAEELVISYGLELPDPLSDMKQETKIPIPTTKVEKSLQLLSITLLKLKIEPLPPNLKITLEIGPCAIPLLPCEKLDKSLSSGGAIDLSKEVSLPDSDLLPSELRNITIKGWVNINWTQ